MAPIKPPKLWIPYLIGSIGILLSILLWYLRYDSVPDPILIGLYPWLDMFFSIMTSILVASIIGITQIARYRAQSLKLEVSERILAEETKQKLEVALLQGQKLQAIGTLAGGIAHDFNNIIYAITGYTELARVDLPKDSAVYKNLGKVLEGTQRGQELIARILAFSRRQQHEHETISLRATIDTALALLRPTIPASVMIEFEPSTDTLIRGNQTQIHQVLMNIINNAVDSMDGEGAILIQLGELAMNDPLLKQYSNLGAKPHCKITISDTGHGMSQATMERIFEPFFTTKEVGKGTGLGLSIVHSIIKEHDGEISVTSQLGQGTRFVILLPEYVTEDKQMETV